MSLVTVSGRLVGRATVIGPGPRVSVVGAGGGAGVGSVTSIAATLSGVTFTGPVTTAGILAGTWNTEAKNVVFAGPASGANAVPTWRALVAADVPGIVDSNVTLTADRVWDFQNGGGTNIEIQGEGAQFQFHAVSDNFKTYIGVDGLLIKNTDVIYFDFDTISGNGYVLGMMTAVGGFFGPINGQFNPRLQTVASSATVTPTADTVDMVVITAQAAALTLANPSPVVNVVQGQKLLIRIKDNGTARAITFGAAYRSLGPTLPTTTVLGKTLYLGFFYNADDAKWDCVASAQQP